MGNDAQLWRATNVSTASFEGRPTCRRDTSPFSEQFRGGVPSTSVQVLLSEGVRSWKPQLCAGCEQRRLRGDDRGILGWPFLFRQALLGTATANRASPNRRGVCVQGPQLSKGPIKKRRHIDAVLPRQPVATRESGVRCEAYVLKKKGKKRMETEEKS